MQPLIPSPVIAVGLLHRGEEAARSFPMFGRWLLRRGLKRTSGLPLQVLVAVTSSTIHLFEIGSPHFNIRIKAEVARWDRAEVGVAISHRTLEDLVTFTPVDGRQIEYEIELGWSRRVNGELLEALGGGRGDIRPPSAI